jgi:hypothetical protein
MAGWLLPQQWAPSVTLVTAGPSLVLQPARGTSSGESEGALSKRVALIPVMPQFYQENKDVAVMAVALVFLVDLPQSAAFCPQGKDCDVSAIFVKAYDDFGAILGQYDPNSDVRFARLVE